MHRGVPGDTRGRPPAADGRAGLVMGDQAPLRLVESEHKTRGLTRLDRWRGGAEARALVLTPPSLPSVRRAPHVASAAVPPT